MLKVFGIEMCEDLYIKWDLIYFLYLLVSFRFLIEVFFGLGNIFIVIDFKRKSIGIEMIFFEISKFSELLDMCDKFC